MDASWSIINYDGYIIVYNVSIVVCHRTQEYEEYIVVLGFSTKSTKYSLYHTKRNDVKNKNNLFVQSEVCFLYDVYIKYDVKNTSPGLTTTLIKRSLVTPGFENFS